MINFGAVPAGSVLPVFFGSYEADTGASVTLSGLAVTDIEIYKGTSMTQRASDAGYTLLDTDGIDIDSTTGINAFSIDTGDNTDSGFFAAGSFYTVVVSSVTVDAQTVNAVVATFRIVAAESSAGTPKADVSHWLGTAAATPTVAGVPEVDVTHFGGSAATTASGRPEVNTTHAAGTAWGSGAITAAAIANGAIDAATFAAGAIDAAALAADAGTEIGTAVWATAARTLTANTNLNDLSAAGVRAAVGLASANLDTQLDALPTAVENADALLDRDMSTGADNGSTTVRTPRQALRILRNKVDIAAGTGTVKKEDDSTTSWTFAVTTDAAAEPIIGVNPAGGA
jgi:hypothetical protein